MWHLNIATIKKSTYVLLIFVLYSIRVLGQQWVIENNISANPEAYIKFFLTNLQLWIKQPKVEILKQVLIYAFEKNFVMVWIKFINNFMK